MSDTVFQGRRFRILSVIDDSSWDNRASVVDTCFSGRHVSRGLDQIALMHGYRCMVVSDNSTELSSNGILAGQEERQVE